LLGKVPLLQVLEAIEQVEKYLERDEKGVFTTESVNIAWSKVGMIAKTLCKPENERKLLYIRGICRNRFTYCDERQCLNLLKKAHDVGVSVDELAEIAKSKRNWSGWKSEMWHLIEQMES